MTFAILGKAALRILGITVPIPVALILAALAWVHFDKSSAVRNAVDDAIKEIVAGGEIAALEAEIAAQREIADRQADVAAESARRTRAAEQALETLNARLAASQAENEIINDDLADLLSRPVRDDCTVGADILDRLRGR